MLPPHLAVPCHELDALPGLPHLLYFFFNRPSPCDLGATSLSFPFWRPVHSGFCNGGFLASDVANPPPASPHQDGSHWFSSTPFRDLYLRLHLAKRCVKYAEGSSCEMWRVLLDPSPLNANILNHTEGL